MRALRPKGIGEGTPYRVPEFEGGLRRAKAGDGVMFSLIFYPVAQRQLSGVGLGLGLGLDLGF